MLGGGGGGVAFYEVKGGRETSELRGCVRVMSGKRGSWSKGRLGVREGRGRHCSQDGPWSYECLGKVVQ